MEYVPYLAQDQWRQLRLQEESLGLGSGHEARLRLQRLELLLVLHTLPLGHRPRIHGRIHRYPSFAKLRLLFLFLLFLLLLLLLLSSYPLRMYVRKWAPACCVCGCSLLACLVRSLRPLLSTHQIHAPRALSLRSLSVPHSLLRRLWPIEYPFWLPTTPRNFHNGFLWSTCKAMQFETEN